MVEGVVLQYIRCWHVDVPGSHPLNAAEEVLDQFREQFIDEMDAEKVVFDLLEADIIDKGDQRTITEAKDTTQQNKILHRCLKEKCTLDALMSVCVIIKAVKGNPKMAGLGNKMLRRLEMKTGMCVKVCVDACALVCVCVRARMCVCVCVCVQMCVHIFVLCTHTHLSVCDLVSALLILPTKLFL